MPENETNEQVQEAMAMLKILALGDKQIQDGKVEPAASVMAGIRERREE